MLLADALERRALPLPQLAGRLREDGLRGRRRIVMTSFGYNDSGGGTIVPRQVSKELARRGYDVTVFHAAVGRVEPPEPYQIREWWEDGVRLVGVFNRPHGLLDLGRPDREVDDPPITRAFAELLDRIRPEAVHFHNLHNLGAALIDEAAVRGIRSVFTTHNYWLACPRGYLFTDRLELCHGPGDRGGDCAACVGSLDADAYRNRLDEVRGAVHAWRRHLPGGVGGDAGDPGRSRVRRRRHRCRPPGHARGWRHLGGARARPPTRPARIRARGRLLRLRAAAKGAEPADRRRPAH